MLGIVALAGAIRLAWINFVPVPPESDFKTFTEMSVVIAHGSWWPNSYGWTFQGFGYPLTIAPFVLVAGVDGIRLANVLFQLGAVLCAWALGRRLFGAASGLAAGGALALFPGAWAYTTLVASENLSMLLLVLIGLVAARPTRRWMPAVAGGSTALLAFARPAYIPFVVVAAMLVAFAGSEGRNARLRSYMVGLALVAVPFLGLNNRFGGPLLPLGNLGVTQWMVHNERATGAWFAATDSDAYPFNGLGPKDDPLDDPLVASAQRKLALQFVILNPAESLKQVAVRHGFNWDDDRQVMNWTVGRPPETGRSRIPTESAFTRFGDAAYTALLGFAAAAAIRFRRDVGVLIGIALPVAYGVVLYDIALGDGRYHAIALPLLAVLAGGLFSAKPGLLWSGLGLFLAMAGGTSGMAGALILLVVGVPVATWIAPSSLRVRSLHDAFAHSSMVRLAALAAVAALVVVAVSTRAIAQRLEAEVRAVDPIGWSGYQRAADGRIAPEPLQLEPTESKPNVRRVSYPDAAMLTFSSTNPGDIAGLQRTIPDLVPGDVYQFYVQVYDPGAEDEEFRVLLNEQVVWRHGPEEQPTGGWRYLSIPWRADASAVTVRVERRAGTATPASRSAAAMVRSLHLYPAY